MALRIGLIIVAAASCTAVAGCGGQTPDAPVTAAATAPATAAMSHAETLARADKAKKTFVIWCSGCHGEYGRGDGPAAAVLVPPPRNLLDEQFKIRSTMSGDPPTPADIFETITRGLPGSAMPNFAFLPEADRWLLVEHVRHLAKLQGLPEPAVVTVGAPVASSPEAVDRGKAIYARLKCADCHGAGGKGDGPAAATLRDFKKRPVPARDYTAGLYLGGDTPAALHMRFRTGMDGTPMPSFADSLTVEEGWDLVSFILSLRTPPAPPPADKVAYGKRVIAEKWCNACHIVEGKGGLVGPSLDLAAAKLRYDWVATYLKDPPAAGTVYPWMPYRMPNLGLKPEEIEAVIHYMASLAKRTYPEPAVVAVAVDEAKASKGLLLYFLKCTECHNLGTVIGTPAAKREGPDLINVSKRVRYEWMPTWVSNPRSVYKEARMVDTNLSEAEVEEVTAFVWKTSVEHADKPK